jgi:lipopolysaccharide/colanic/teichoic acid biosynthesis glycosyltransferase
MRKIIKLFFDYFLSFSLLIILFPIILIISLLILFIDGKPIFFIQKRQGLNESIFNIYKFRTMKNNDGNNSSDQERTTHIGAILRKFSLDELPTLLNVIMGEMSFVGPRPLLAEYSNLYNDDQKKRFLMKPGITGWAQINGRNSISWEKKFELDLWYIKNHSLFLDLQILLKTILKIFINKDVNSSNENTMDKFGTP